MKRRFHIPVELDRRFILSHLFDGFYGNVLAVYFHTLSGHRFGQVCGGHGAEDTPLLRLGGDNKRKALYLRCERLCVGKYLSSKIENFMLR